MELVKVLFFDVFGTVVDWRSGVSRAAAPFLRRHGLDRADPALFADAWAGRYTAAADDIRRGARPFASLDALNRENLEGTLAELGIDPSTLPHAELDDINMAWRRLDPWPDSVQGLAALKKRYIIAPFSTGNTSLLLNMAKHAGLPWDTVLGTDILGAYKPSPQAYRRAAELVGVSPEEACLVAAHNDDLAGARDCGMRTAFVMRPNEHGPAQTTDLAPAEDWDVIADDLPDLAARLGA